jgi:putative ABC transport system substrate-binding protein
MSNRRKMVIALGAGALTAPFGSFAQQPAAKIPRIGFLSPGAPFDAGRNPSALAVLFGALRESLRELGYGEGRNIVIESRWAEGKYDQLPRLAAELISLKVDVIVTYGTPAAQAAQRATSTIPIVMAGIIDPVASGLIRNLARPGGNITGQSMMSPDLVAKQLEMLKEVVPKLSRVALLSNPANPGNAPQVKYGQDAGRALGLQIQALKASNPGDIDRAFSVMSEERAGGLVVLVDAALLDHRARIVDLAARSHLPAMYGLSDYTEAGGLMAYGPNRLAMFQHAATYVDKILKGAKPGDLPVEQPTKFELIVNMKTVKALGIKIPDSIMLRADKVIE